MRCEAFVVGLGWVADISIPAIIRAFFVQLVHQAVACGFGNNRGCGYGMALQISLYNGDGLVGWIRKRLVAINENDRWRGICRQGSDSVKVVACMGIEAGVEGSRRLLDMSDNDAVWEQAIEVATQFVGIDRQFGVEMGDLAGCMHASVRSARAHDLWTGLQNNFESLFERFLHGWLVWLDLPAMKVCTVVFDAHAVAHGERVLIA